MPYSLNPGYAALRRDRIVVRLVWMVAAAFAVQVAFTPDALMQPLASFPPLSMVTNATWPWCARKKLSACTVWVTVWPQLLELSIDVVVAPPHEMLSSTRPGKRVASWVKT